MKPSSLARVQWHARQQLDLFTLEQVLGAGFDRMTVRRWLKARVWEEPAPRVYRYSGSELTWQQQLLAATLSGRALAAARCAAALYGLQPAPAQPELLVVRGRRNLARAKVHSTIDLPVSDISAVGAIPTTAPMRTVIDAASSVPRCEVENLVDRAMLRRFVQPARLERRARDLVAPRRPGARRVLTALSTMHPELEEARNDWEAQVLRLVARFGLPDPIPNYEIIVGGRQRFLDFAWPPPQVCLEYDGYEPHMETRQVFDDDRDRQNDLVAAGWLVFRLTNGMLKTRTSDRHFRAIAAALSHRSHVGATDV